MCATGSGLADLKAARASSERAGVTIRLTFAPGQASGPSNFTRNCRVGKSAGGRTPPALRDQRNRTKAFFKVIQTPQAIGMPTTSQAPTEVALSRHAPMPIEPC